MSTQIKTESIKLAIKYCDSSEIPRRFKEKKSESDKKINLNTQIEINFQLRVNDWENTLTLLLEKMDTNLAWIFIYQKPTKEPEIKSAAYHREFKLFTDYLILRRDKENCDDGELACLSMLHTSFQKQIDGQA
jgi:hypothetical protein